MPLVKEIQIDSSTRIGIWDVAEDAQQLKWKLQWGQDDIKRFAAMNDEERSMHWLSSRVLIRHMLHTTHFIDLQVDEFGKPFLNNFEYKLSISHSGNRVAVILSDREVGIDIQHISTKILDLYSRFASKEEIEYLQEPNEIEKMFVVWCGKEALYKLYGKKKLDFRQNLAIDKFDWETEGVAKGHIIKGPYHKDLPVHYQKMDDYLLVYAVDEKV